MYPVDPRLDTKAGQALPVGGFMSILAKTNHFLYTKGEAIIQVMGLGPFDITYVNPSDDPRKTTSKTPAVN